jgi:hypothetical protein
LRLFKEIFLLNINNKMIEIIQVWDLFTTQNFDFEFMEMEKLDCFKKIQDEYEYIFRESEKKGRCNDASVGGFDCYQRVNKCLSWDCPSRKDIQFTNDSQYEAFIEYLRKGIEELNKRVIAELTRGFKLQKQAKNSRDALEAKQKTCKFICEVCDIPCYTNSSIAWEAHITTASHIKKIGGDPRQYTCDACGQEFENTKIRNRHVDALKCFQSRTCKDCGTCLSTKQRYEGHFINGICNNIIKEAISSGQLDKLKCSNLLS